jgi:DNA adenine methylase
MNSLPVYREHIKTPPLKCQGIKTKLVRFLLENIQWDDQGKGRWIEPFAGSGVVAFNLAPERALLADTNQHIISLYQAIQRGTINKTSVRAFLEREGGKLEQEGASFYYKVRERFNEYGHPLDFLFLNRSCFNGVIRFNRQGNFNVPFGHKTRRFTKSYITKIVNQVAWVETQISGKAWEFKVADWETTLSEVAPEDFVYLDPPYIGRNTDYYNSWGEEDALHLAEAARHLKCGFALSMWLKNRYRKNEHLETCWRELDTRVCSHFYHVGSKEDYRNEIQEALLIKPGFSVARQEIAEVPVCSSERVWT